MSIKKLIYFSKIHWEKIVITVILLASLAIRLQFLDYPLVNGEAHRDFLVGSHMLKYGDIPLTGPCCLFNGEYGMIRNAPLYHYIISFILIFNNDMMFLQSMHILFQLATIFFIYQIGKQLFRTTTGLMASTLYSSSWIVFWQSRYFWQPYTMAFLIHLSILLFVLAHTKKEIKFLYASIVFFFFAAAVHNAVYALVPQYLFIIFLMTKKIIKKRLIWRNSLIFAGLAFALSYIPWFIDLFKNKRALLESVGNSTFTLPISNFYLFMANFFRNTVEFYRLFFFDYILLTGFFFLGLLFYISKQKNRLQANYCFILFITITFSIAFFSLFNITLSRFYFTALFGMLVIVVAETTSFLFSQIKGKKYLFILKELMQGAILILLVSIFSHNFAILSTKSPLENYKKTNEAIQAIKREIYSIKEKEQLKNLNFFTLDVYAKVHSIESQPNASMPFWILLEKELNQKLIKSVDDGSGYIILNENRYEFIICQSITAPLDDTRECLRPHFEKNPRQRLVGQIFKNEIFTIYAMKSRSLDK